MSLDSTPTIVPAVTGTHDTADLRPVTPSTCSMLGLDDNNGEFFMLSPTNCLSKCPSHEDVVSVSVASRLQHKLHRFPSTIFPIRPPCSPSLSSSTDVVQDVVDDQATPTPTNCLSECPSKDAYTSVSVSMSSAAPSLSIVPELPAFVVGSRVPGIRRALQ